MALSVAPMMEWTDRHYRFLARMLTSKTVLYTEMVVADDIVKKELMPLDVLLEFSEEEHPIALQLGGSDPEVLAKATEIVGRNAKCVRTFFALKIPTRELAHIIGFKT